MMNTTYETYMNALKQGLASFDSAAAEDAAGSAVSCAFLPQPDVKDAIIAAVSNTANIFFFISYTS